jgi:hypothetical protein
MAGRAQRGLLLVASVLVVAAACGGSSKSNSTKGGGAEAGDGGEAGFWPFPGEGGEAGFSFFPNEGGSTATGGGAGAGAAGRGGGGNGGGLAGSAALGGTTAQGGSTTNGGQAGKAGASAGAGRGGSDLGQAGEAAAAGAGGAGGANGFAPDDLGARLVLWLDAGHAGVTVDGTKLSAWPDRSSAHNDALQSVTASRPLYVASGLNARPTVRFDGQATFLDITDVPSLRWGTGPFAVFAVVRGAPATVVNAMIFQKTARDDPFAGPQLFVNPNKPNGESTKISIQVDGNTYTVSNTGMADTTPRLLVGRRYETATDTVLELRENGAFESRITLSTPVNIDAVGRDAIIGHNGYVPSPGFQAYQGDISELCAVQGTLTSGELAEMESYLMEKYGL